jgi:hypothetical protein
VPARWALCCLLVAGSCVGPGLEPPGQRSRDVSGAAPVPSGATTMAPGMTDPATQTPPSNGAGAAAMAPAPVQPTGMPAPMAPAADAGEMDGGTSDPLSGDDDADAGL